MEDNQEFIDPELELQLKRPIGVAMLPLEWFLLLSLIDRALASEKVVTEFFSSKEDVEAIRMLAENIHRQAFPEKKTESPIITGKKELILPKGPQLIV